ncbi:glycosyltransferase [Desulfonatronum parangueonense]
MKKILTISMLYPSVEAPHFGVFIKREVDSVATYFDQMVVVPQPWRSPCHFLSSWQNDPLKVRDNHGVEVIYKRYFPLPGRWLQPIKGVWFFLFLIRTVMKLRKNFNFDLIHAHNVYPEGFCATLIKKFVHRPVIISSRGNDLHKLPENVFLRLMIKSALLNADSVITVSKSLAQKAIQLGTDSNKIFVMPKGVDTHVFRPIPRQKAREELGLPLEKQIVLSVGWLIPRKNPFSFVEVLKRYDKAKRERLLFVWVGEGPMQSKLESELRANGLERNVLLAGRRPPEDIALWMNSADIFMLVSFSEGMPNVLYEALACGIPVIASNVDGASEILKDMQNGVLVDPNNYNQIYSRMQKLLEDSDTRDAIGQKGKMLLDEKQLTLEQNAAWIKRKYESIVL